MDMIQLFDVNVGSSVSEIVQGVSEFLMAACAVVGGWCGWKKWSDEKAMARSNRLDALLEKFSANELRKRICVLDSSGGASDLIKRAMNFSESEIESEDKLKVEDSLMFIALLCQLKMKNVFSENEFLLFNDSVKKILDDDDVKAYIDRAVIDSGFADDDTHYGILLKYARENGIDMNVDNQNYNQTRKVDIMKQDEAKVKSVVQSDSIRKSDFDKPTAIIKINRLYKDGMSDGEVYEKVRGWWRLRMDAANKVTLVLAVANGVVRGVYKVKKWVPSTNPTEAGRIGFIGEPATQEVQDKFMGRSVRALFSKGAANPVRYFNVR